MFVVKIIHLRGAAIAQWIRLRLPSYRPGFESQALHQNKQKEAGIGPFKKDYTYFRLFLFSVHFHLFMACIKTVDPKMMPHRLRCYLAQVMNT